MRITLRFRSLFSAILPLIALSIGALAIRPEPLMAQDWREQVAQQLISSRMVRTFFAEGYWSSHDPYLDLTPRGGTGTVTLTLRAGFNYRIVGKCDNDCSDLDLRLRDGRAVVASDFEYDDYPLIDVTPTRTDTYTLDAVMTSCSTRDCGWGVLGVARATAGAAAQRSRQVEPAPFRRARAEGGTGGGAAATAWRSEIERQFARSELLRRYSLAGFERTFDPIYDLLPREGSQSVRLDLRAGRSYAILGRCDNDCGDLDFQLFDETGNEVARDLSTDDVPLLRVTPLRSGIFRLRVTMANCRTRSCGWGAQVMSR